jgi:hypothetical protein
MTAATDDDLGQLLATVTAAMQRIIDWADGRLNALQRGDDELRVRIESLQKEVTRLRVQLGTATEAATPSGPTLTEPAPRMF